MADKIAILETLLKAKSKGVVEGVFQTSFRFLTLGTIPQRLLDTFTEAFELESSEETSRLIRVLQTLIRRVLYNDLAEEEVTGLFPEDFHPQLKGLIVSILTSNAEGWKGQTVQTQVGPPSLLDFDWRVDLQTSSDKVARMSIPSVLLELQVQKQREDAAIFPCAESLTLELDKESLQTMLDGLSTIRDQLSSV
mmetsp:Transcript_13976/g.35984  ORF Transcript_13976/g.35984 Transcript_13976/m.35984 type:complete len:194 (-) Transcript_13976:492-1073(-)|eukprot:CAMPEP_0113886800 /NCGR_PEP_ID=MMETSP0780_2-20120614/11783_1 /TAXON_ID=652834 /ORGANISM="Palpitomonas bilix" /LENGTH=193 /DNA_ID=CAMNT_0000875109 /DNA_START=127 /DNA_END=708 /DNA_ORIENTATION=- /assembly_acc=CAM_ASM_000599